MNEKYSHLSEAELNAHHAQKMAKKNEARHKMMAKIQQTKGLIMVYTGKGKGKTTAAMGLALRALGRGKRVGIVQFVKGAMDTGERIMFAKMENILIQAMGDGFTWNTQNRAQDIASAQKAWDFALSLINNPEYDLIILDEINIVLKYEYLEIAKICEALQNKRPDLHIVLTGRNAREEIVQLADLVTECTEIKHPFKSGIKAQEAIEY